MQTQRSETENTLRAMASMAADGNADWRTLPPDAYTNPEIHALEVEKIFKASWLVLGRVDEVEQRGSYVAREMVGQAVVMVRGQDDKLRVFSNICRHRWMKLLEGKGRKAVITCPYHAWAYGTDGALRRAPDMERHPDFDPSCVRLEELNFEIWQGFVFVNLDGKASPLAPRLTGLTKRVKGFGLEDWVTARTVESGDVAWDWKVMQDNGECYHHEGLHPETFQRVFPGERSRCEVEGDWIFQWNPVREEALEKTAAGEPIMPGLFFEPLEGLNDFERTNFHLFYVLPNYLFYLQPDCGIMIRCFPTAAGRMYMETDLLVPRAARELPDYEERLDRLDAFFNRFNDEDTTANSAIQKNLESGRVAPAPLSHLEAHNRHVAWWIASKLTAGDNAAAMAAE
jgi:phenylpropionate dioxygenase-like ring-hydroxylating dioxygenase large terminal subunit